MKIKPTRVRTVGSAQGSLNNSWERPVDPSEPERAPQMPEIDLQAILDSVKDDRKAEA